MLIDTNELIGQTLGTCTLQQLVGRGGMGAVYLARQSRPRRTVAVKVLMPGVFLEEHTSSEFLNRFRREADAIAMLDHINIMPVYEYGELSELAYLVMPYITGGTLRDVLQKRQRLPLNEVLTIVDQAAAALDCAHAEGIVHRDLKPGNMLFHADGRLLLADFGLAKTVGDVRDAEYANGQTALTHSGTIIGTPEYLAPEQGTGKAVDARTDIYSLGIVIFQMLAGRVPFQGPSPVAVAIKHAMEPPPSLTELNPDVPPQIEAVVHKAMAKDPAQRFASAGELAHALHLAVMQIHATPFIPEIQEKLGVITLSALEESPVPPSAPTEAQPRVASPFPAPPPQTPIPEAETIAEPIVTVRPIADPARRNQMQHALQSEPVPNAALARPSAQQAQPASTFTVATAQRVLSKSATIENPQREHTATNRKPTRLLQIGLIAVVLLLLIGGTVAWFQFLPGRSLLNGTETTSTPSSVSPPAATPTNTVAPLPSAAIGEAGKLLYGTSQPGVKCDPHATWTKSENATLTCTNGLTLAHSGGDKLATTTLDQLPDAQLPADYVLQAQVDLSSSNGTFGLVFRHQNTGSLVYLIDPATSTFRAIVTDDSTGSTINLYTGSINSGRPTGIVTVDIVVKGNSYILYINGKFQGQAGSTYYPQGGIGLAANKGASIQFKNIAVYALK